MRHFFFTINFAFGLMFLVGCFYSIGAMATPGSLCSGITFVLPTAAFLVAEWIAWFRHKREVARTLGIICVVLGGFTIFGVIANVAEAISSGWPAGFGWFVFVGLTIAAYLLGCGWWRLRVYQASNQRLQLTGDARE